VRGLVGGAAAALGLGGKSIGGQLEVLGSLVGLLGSLLPKLVLDLFVVLRQSLQVLQLFVRSLRLGLLEVGKFRQLTGRLLLFLSDALGVLVFPRGHSFLIFRLLLPFSDALVEIDVGFPALPLALVLVDRNSRERVIFVEILLLPAFRGVSQLLIEGFLMPGG
jgi:hypothetical protein